MFDHSKELDNLSRIEGQIRGVKKMIEDGRECKDIITQMFAISGAVNSSAKNLLKDHINCCIVSAIKAGDNAHGVEELSELLERLFKVK